MAAIEMVLFHIALAEHCNGSSAAHPVILVFRGVPRGPFIFRLN